MPDQRCFVGFGFGPIQSGLFLYEAYRTGRFARLVVAEVDERIVGMLRGSGGQYHLNIAHAGGIEKATICGVEVYNPRKAEDRAKLLAAIGEADELSTALPSVEFFASGGESSVVSVLADALVAAPKKRRVLYAAENHNHAAEILTEHLVQRKAALEGFQVVNTVIGKMSGVITDPGQIKESGLATLTPTADRAVLVEAFNRILIGRVMAGFNRGINAFIEKDDLLPFEEAKLYGHNAIHALIGYLAHQRGLTLMSQVAAPVHREILEVARRAFLEESGVALVRKYAHLKDPFFTEAGYKAYAEDLLERMVNPNLQDLVARVIRDPQRKLGWSDRLFGTMRLAMEYGVRPVSMARGAAAAVEFLIGRSPESKQEVEKVLHEVWGEAAKEPVAAELVELTWEAVRAGAGCT